MARQKFAKVTWQPEDVIEEANALGIKLTLKQARELLDSRERKIQEAMSDAGWESIRFFLDWDIAPNAH